VRQRREQACGAHLFELCDRCREVAASIGELTQARPRPGHRLGIARRLALREQGRELRFCVGGVLLEPQGQLGLGQPQLALIAIA